MKPALATLPSVRGPVLIVDRGRLKALSFESREDAVRYLDAWRGDAEGMAALRSAARDLPGVPDSALSNDTAVIAAVARAVFQGLVVLVEPAVSVPPMPVRRTTVAAKASPPPGTARAVLAAEPPPPPPPPPVLPALEKVSVEGAEVLPEVLQALDQIAAALQQVEEMTASLAPAPDGIPAIAQEMTDAVSDVKDRLGEV